MSSTIKQDIRLKDDTFALNSKESRKREKQIKLANRLLDEILICLNAHIHEVSPYPLEETVQSIVCEIFRYKEYSNPTR